MKSRIAIGMLLMLPLSQPPVAAASAPAAPIAPVIEQLIGPAKFSNLIHVELSPDGRHVAWVRSKGRQQYIAVDGVDGPLYDLVMRETPIFSADGGHYIYGTKQGNTWLVVHDGREGPPFASIGEGSLRIGGSGEHYAYLGRREGMWLAVHDGRENAEFDAMSGDNFVLSGDGRRLVFAASRDTTVGVVVDDRMIEGGPVMDKSLGFSTDGRRFAYVVSTEAGMAAVVDGLAGAEHLIVDTPAFSPDGSRVAYRARDGERWMAVVDGQPGPAYLECRQPVFSLDGLQVAYWAQREDSAWTLVWNGRESYTCRREWPGGPAFAADGGRVGVYSNEGGDWLAVIVTPDSVLYRAPSIGPPIFSPDGRHFAHIQLTGKRPRVIVDGHAGRDVDGMIAMLGTSLTPHIVFSPDGARIAYVAYRGSSKTAVIETLGGEGQEVSGSSDELPAFSADGQHVACKAQRGKKTVVVLDGAEGPAYEGVLSPRLFMNGDGTVEYLAVRGKSLYRVRQGRPSEGR